MYRRKGENGLGLNPSSFHQLIKPLVEPNFNKKKDKNKKFELIDKNKPQEHFYQMATYIQDDPDNFLPDFIVVVLIHFEKYGEYKSNDIKLITAVAPMDKRSKSELASKSWNLGSSLKTSLVPYPSNYDKGVKKSDDGEDDHFDKKRWDKYEEPIRIFPSTRAHSVNIFSYWDGWYMIYPMTMDC